MKKRGIVAGIIAALIVLDQLVKAYVVQNIALEEIKSWIPNLVSLTYLQNRGAAFFDAPRSTVVFCSDYPGSHGWSYLVSS